MPRPCLDRHVLNIDELEPLCAAALSPFRLDGADGVEDFAVSADGATATFSYDGTSPVSFRVSYDASRPGVLSAILVAPVP